jgi:ubiquinone biosynthesis protein COQ9
MATGNVHVTLEERLLKEALAKFGYEPHGPVVAPRGPGELVQVMLAPWAARA